MKRDIESAEDIRLLVNRFYDKVKSDPIIGFIFNDVVKVNWNNHLPVMYRFWENVLFHTGTYGSNPMEVHLSLNDRVPLKGEHFKQWKKLFLETIDEFFEGDIAEMARQRALSIATVMEIKIAARREGLSLN